MITKDECLPALSSAFTMIEEILNVNDQNLIGGILKFADRLKKIPPLKLSTCLQCEWCNQH